MVPQVGAGGELQRTIRRFPSVVRTLCEALGSERWPIRGGWLGEEEFDADIYRQEVPCDWTVGSFMLARREAIDAAGFLDERFFLYQEEPRSLSSSGSSRVGGVASPSLTVVHHGGDRTQTPELRAQEAFSRRLYMQKHFAWPRRIAGLASLALGFSIRAALGRRSVDGGGRRASARALAALLGFSLPPFGPPPRQSVAAREWRASDTDS